MVDHNVIFDSLLGNKMSGNALDQVIILLDGDKMHTTTGKPMSTIAWVHQTALLFLDILHVLPFTAQTLRLEYTVTRCEICSGLVYIYWPQLL